MLAYIFSFILVVFCFFTGLYYRKQSKPEQLFLNPNLAKSNMLDRYLEVEKMPKGISKTQAYQQWQQDCGSLYRQLSSNEKELKVKLTDS